MPPPPSGVSDQLGDVQSGPGGVYPGTRPGVGASEPIPASTEQDTQINVQDEHGKPINSDGQQPSQGTNRENLVYLTCKCLLV